MNIKRFSTTNLTRLICNPNNGSNQGGGFGGATTHPFNSAGTNVFDQMNRAANPQQQGGMEAPAMQPNGMPAGTNPPPLESMQVNTQSQWAPNVPPQAGQQQAPTQQGGSPLDIYNPTPDNSTQGGQQPQAPATPPAEAPKSLFDTDLKGWEGVTANVDLAAGVEPEKVQLALSGQPESAGALMEIIQQVSRTAMTQAAFMSTKVAGSGVQNSLDQFGKTVPNMITDHQFSGIWQGNDVMNHPSAKPMVDALTQQFRTQHPQATPEQVRDQVEHYMQTFAQAQGMQKAPTENTPDTNTGNVSLSSFFANQ